MFEVRHVEIGMFSDLLGEVLATHTRTHTRAL